MKPGTLVKLKKKSKFIPEWCGVLVYLGNDHDLYDHSVRNEKGETGFIPEDQIRKLWFWEILAYRWKKYRSPAQRIARLEKAVYNLKSHVGSDYHNPLGTAFDVHDSQEEFDDFIRGTIKRYEEKIEKLKLKL